MDRQESHHLSIHSVAWSSFKTWITSMFCCTLMRRLGSDPHQSTTTQTTVTLEQRPSYDEISGQKRTCGQDLQNLQDLENRVTGLKDRNKQLEKKYHDVDRERQEALLRLSQLASSKLRDNNPNIVDLNDQFRPTKLVEMFSELYDNEWTDAYTVMQDELNDAQIIAFLLDIVMAAYTYCQWKCEEVWHIADKWFLNNDSPTNQQTRKALKDAWKNNVPRVEGQIRKEFKLWFSDCRTWTCFGTFIKKDGLGHYISVCVRLCLLMVTTDPPVVLYCPRWKPQRRQKHTDKQRHACVRAIDLPSSSKREIRQPSNGNDLHTPICMKYKMGTEDGKIELHPFDHTCFKIFTRKGEYEEFIVWPAMKLHCGGPLLSKGVAQGIVA